MRNRVDSCSKLTPRWSSMPWDASIDLTDQVMLPGVSDATTAAKVRAAVEALHGAGWISVEQCPETPPGLQWVVAYRDGPAAEIEATVRATIANQLV